MRLSSPISGDIEGTTIVSISWLLEGPLTVVIEGNKSTDHETARNRETGETNLVIIYPEQEKDTIITGTNKLAEFAYSVSVPLAALGAVIV